MRKNLIFKKLIPVLFIFLFSDLLIAQETKDSVSVLSPSLTLIYESISPDSVRLTADISVRKEETVYGLSNAVLKFTAKGDNSEFPLGNIRTDSAGNATLTFKFNNGIPSDKDGLTNYNVSFDGTSSYQPASASVSAKRAVINIRFSQDDSTRNIHLKVFQFEKNQKVIPVAKQSVTLYVPRLFSLLKIGEADLDENGEAVVPFTHQLVGDSLGNLRIVAKIEENDLFGNVVAINTVSWGVPKQYYTAEKPTRELWTPVAPIWMIITLIIMLTGVWAHYIYAVVQMVMIKRHSKQKKEYF